MKSRDYLFDNAKAFLMFCVILGHVLESHLDGSMKILYIIIYSFHMPLFVFISGYFASYKPNKMLKQLILPYVVFQLIGCLITQNKNGVQFAKPIWILWYLLALIIWKMLIPFIQQEDPKVRRGIFAFSILLGLYIGYDKTIGYYMSLSRIIVFFPFFIAGFYLRDVKENNTIIYQVYKRFPKELCLVTATAIIAFICFFAKDINPKWLYGSYNYEKLSYNPMIRLIIYMIAFIMSFAILKLMTSEKTLFSIIGQRSMYIYLGHGIIVIVMRQMDKIFGGLPENQMMAISLAASLLIILIFSTNLRSQNHARSGINSHSLHVFSN